jgi:hypothetical protein
LADSIRRGQIAARHTCSQRGTTANLISAEKMAAYFTGES